jgi:hypothetical protein
MTSILEWTRSIIVTTPERWLNLVDAVPTELLLMRPAPNEWSALDCLQHMVDVERDSFPVRVKALLAGTSFPGFAPGDNGIKAPPTIALAAEFDQLRKKNLILFNQITEGDLDRQALHAEYGRVSMREFLHHWAAHDLNHTVQAERALMQPYIYGCGPWQVVYTDQIAKTE